MKKIVFCLCLLIFPISVMAANITVDKNSFDKDTGVLTIGGAANEDYDQILISLFEGDDLVAFKTAEVKTGKYETTFKLNYKSETKLSIKLANESADEVINNKIVILESVKPVATGDNIVIYSVLGLLAITSLIIIIFKKRKGVKVH